MTSLRQLLEAKQRRTAQLPVLIGEARASPPPPAAASAALQAHEVLLASRENTEDQSDDEKATGERLRAELQAALEQQAQTVVLVDLQALPDDEWDAVFGEVEPDADGELALDDFRAALLAACCVDPELQDTAWWEQQLALPQWSKGDKIHADRVLLDLNLAVPRGPLGKD